MLDNKTITGIILAAGNSSRFGKNRNKNFEIIHGKAVLSYSLIAFEKNQYIDNIIIAMKEEEKGEIEKIIHQEEYQKDIQMIIGGSTRAESVYHCIKATDSDIVMIHDGARPFIQQRFINECVENMREYQAVTVGVKAKDTIKITNENNIVICTTKRKNTWLSQTPQCFNRNILLKMHEKYQKEEVTDDCELLEKENYEVKMIEGDEKNLKITTYEDAEIIRQFLI